MSDLNASTPAGLPQLGDLLAGKYRIEKLLGMGGMGAVYGANHEILSQRVAIKVLLAEIASNQEAVARFLNEARASAKIQNEHCARVMDVGTLEGGQAFMVMEYLEGCDLGQLLERSGPLNITTAVDYVLQSLEALAHAHALQLVHRDLKPANLFLARQQDGSEIVKVLDFGISKATNGPGGTNPSLTSTKAILGSPLYMSPEQLRSSKSVDPRADIWALGVILYELVTGKPPYDGDNVGELFAAILEKDAVSLRARRPDVPPGLDQAVLCCLRRDPNQRFGDVGQLAEALAPFASPAGVVSVERVRRSLHTLTAGGPSPQRVGLSASGGVPGPSRQTAAAWADSGLTTKKGTGVGPLLGIAVVLAMLVVGAVFVLHRRADVTVAVTSRPSATASVPLPAQTASAVPSAEPPETPSAAASTSPSAVASGSPVASAVSAAPPSHAGAPHAKATPPLTTPPAATKPSHSATPTPTYDPTKDPSTM
jgi:eukaryotic-like serine/threonine-protein kinase